MGLFDRWCVQIFDTVYLFYKVKKRNHSWTILFDEALKRLVGLVSEHHWFINFTLSTYLNFLSQLLCTLPWQNVPFINQQKLRALNSHTMQFSFHSLGQSVISQHDCMLLSKDFFKDNKSGHLPYQTYQEETGSVIIRKQDKKAQLKKVRWIPSLKPKRKTCD